MHHTWRFLFPLDLPIFDFEMLKILLKSTSDWKHICQNVDESSMVKKGFIMTLSRQCESQKEVDLGTLQKDSIKVYHVQVELARKQKYFKDRFNKARYFELYYGHNIKLLYSCIHKIVWNVMKWVDDKSKWLRIMMAPEKEMHFWGCTRVQRWSRESFQMAPCSDVPRV